MALSFFIQEGVVSTGKKAVGTIAQLFDVTAWLKFALKSLGVAYFDPCEPTCTPKGPTTLGTWTNATKPTGVAGVPIMGYNLDTTHFEIWTGSNWTYILPSALD